MNSLVSPTKVITTESIPNPILSTSVSNLAIPNKIPVSSIAIPITSIRVSENENPLENSPEIVDAQIENNEDIEKIDDKPLVEPMDCGMMSPKHAIEVDNISPESESHKQIKEDKQITMTKSLLEDVIMAETVSNGSNSMQVETSSDTSLVSTNSDVVIEEKNTSERDINADDILLLCDLFYLPFEHGSQGMKLLNEFQWLKINAAVMSGNKMGASNEKPEVSLIRIYNLR